MSALTLLSLGAGVQSTTLALMAAEGSIGPLDGAIFADTKAEPAEVYAHLDRLEKVLADAGIPLYRVSQGDEPEPKRPVDEFGYERGGCDYCEHPSMRMYGRVLANHPEFRRWRKVVDHHYRPALVPTTERCWGSGQPPRFAARAES